MRILLPVLLLVIAGCSSGQPEGASAADASSTAASQEIPSAPPQAPPKTTVPAPPPPPAPADIDPEALAVVHEYTRMFYDGELDLLRDKFSEELRGILPMDKLSALYEQVITDYGTETRVIAEDSQSNEDYRAFVRWARFDKTDDVIEVQWILHASSDEIAGFFIRPATREVKAEGR